MTEEKAIKLLKKGSTEALEWFIGKYTPYVSTVVHNIIGSTMSIADVEEVTSDVFYIFWTKADCVRASSVRGFLGCIARNRAKNKFREAGFEISLDEDFLIAEDMSLEDRCLEQEMREAVQREVLSLKEPDREIVMRFYYYFQSIAEIAAAVGMSESNIKIRLHRVRKKLKEILASVVFD